MKIRFLRDYRGKLTSNTFYEAGSVVSLPNGYEIVRRGAAEPAGKALTDKEKALRKKRSATAKKMHAKKKATKNDQA